MMTHIVAKTSKNTAKDKAVLFFLHKYFETLFFFFNKQYIHNASFILHFSSQIFQLHFCCKTKMNNYRLGVHLVVFIVYFFVKGIRRIFKKMGRPSPKTLIYLINKQTYCTIHAPCLLKPYILTNGKFISSLQFWTLTCSDYIYSTVLLWCSFGLFDSRGHYELKKINV